MRQWSLYKRLLTYTESLTDI